MVEILLKLLVSSIIFLLGLLIGRKTSKTRKDKKLRSREESEKEKEIHNQLASQLTYLKNRNEDLIHENTELRKEISQLQENKIKQVNSTIESNPPKTTDQENRVLENSERNLDITPKSQFISVFFKYPEGDGSFKKIYGTSIKDNDSYYEIVFRENSQEGELKFIADRGSYGKILTIRDTSIIPVSEIENLGEIDRPTNITVIKNGIVEKKEDRFIIKEGYKLKIKVS